MFLSSPDPAASAAHILEKRGRRFMFARIWRRNKCTFLRWWVYRPLQKRRKKSLNITLHHRCLMLFFIARVTTTKWQILFYLFCCMCFILSNVYVTKRWHVIVEEMHGKWKISNTFFSLLNSLELSSLIRNYTLYAHSLARVKPFIGYAWGHVRMVWHFTSGLMVFFSHLAKC